MLGDASLTGKALCEQATGELPKIEAFKIDDAAFSSKLTDLQNLISGMDDALDKASTCKGKEIAAAKAAKKNAENVAD